MNKTIPTVDEFMSLAPYVVTVDEPLAVAHALMKARSIRHLAVLDGPRPVGILSEGDLYRAESTLGVDAATASVRSILAPHYLVVPPTARIDEVVQQMTGGKLDSALVVGDAGKLMGIFTSTDALAAFAALLMTRLA